MQRMYDRFENEMEKHKGELCYKISQELREQGDYDNYAKMEAYRAFCFGYELAKQESNSTVSIFS